MSEDQNVKDNESAERGAASANNCGCTDVFDAQLDAVNTAWRLLEAAFARAVSSLQTQRNATLPMNRLPVELLCSIFRLSRSDYKTLLRISHVCTHWREVLAQDAASWSSIDTKALSEGAAHFFAQRSGKCLLTFSHGARSNETSVMTEQSWQYKLWRKEMHRVSRLDLQLNRDDPLSKDPPPISWLADASAPHLQSLTLTVNRWWGGASSVFPNLTAGFPNLRQLALNDVRLPWASGQYQGLTKLHIRIQCHISTHPMDQSIVHVFRESPLLEDLLLDIQYPPAPMFVDATPIRHPRDRVHLRSAKSIRLALTRQDMVFVLSALSLPEDLAFLSLRTTVPHDVSYCITTAGAHLLPLRHLTDCFLNFEVGTVHFRKRTAEQWSFSTEVGVSLLNDTCLKTSFAVLSAIEELDSSNTLSNVSLRRIPEGYPVMPVAIRHITQLPNLQRLALLKCGGDALGYLESALDFADRDRKLQRLWLGHMQLPVVPLWKLCSSRRNQLTDFKMVDCTLTSDSEEQIYEILQRIRASFGGNIYLGSLSYMLTDAKPAVPQPLML